MNTKTIHLHKISKESLSPREFVNLKAGDKANISITIWSLLYLIATPNKPENSTTNML